MIYRVVIKSSHGPPVFRVDGLFKHSTTVKPIQKDQINYILTIFGEISDKTEKV